MTTSRILIVEDEAIVAMDIRSRLGLLGYEVAGVAVTGDQAIALAQRERPDLVLMDIRLQGSMDGIAAALQIRQLYELPVVFLTAYAEDATLERAKLAEPFGYVLKPFEDRELKTGIEMALYKHHAERQIRHVNRLYAVLSETNQMIVRTRSRDALLQAACRITVEQGVFRAALIAWQDPDAADFRVVGQQGQNLGALAALLLGVPPPGMGVPGPRAILLEGRAWIYSPVPAAPSPTADAAAPAPADFGAAAAVPLRCQGVVRGFLGVGAMESAFFQDQEIRLLEEVALDLSFALDNLELAAERDRTEAALRENEAKYRLLFEQASDAILLMAEDRFIDCNARTLEMFGGVERDAIVGHSPVEFSPPAQPDGRESETAARERMAAARGGQPQCFEWLHVRRDGTPFPAEVNLNRVCVGGRVLLQAIVRDISARKRAEADLRESEERYRALQIQLIQAQKLEAIGQLAGGIAHDFNNILTAVLMQLTLLQGESDLSPDLRTGLADLEVEAKRAASLTRQLLMFSRRQVLQTRTLDLNALLGDLLKMLRRLIGEQIMLEFNGTPGDLWLTADPGMLEQVVMNLVVNARDAMAQGGRITLTTRRVELGPEVRARNPEALPGQFACLAVADTGCGMDDDTLQHIFEPFFTTKEPGKGTGLGLATVYGIVKQHNGWLEVESQPQRGTTFRVYLPSASADAVHKVTVGQTRAVPRGTETLLVVEDDEAVRRVTASILRRLGYRVLEAGDGPEALAVWARERDHIDLLLTDMVMPGRLSGQELARRLRQDKPALKCLLVSGYSRELAQAGLADPAETAFLAKPIEPTALAERVRACLDGPAR